MKNNYRKALQRAQQGTTIKPPKKYQSVGAVNPEGSVIGNVDMNNDGIPDYLERGSVIPMEGSQGSYDVNTGVFPSAPKVSDTMQMAQIGKENYMSALKNFRKGGSK